MPTPTSAELKSASAVAEIGYCNPFTPRRIELERAVLQEAFVWSDDAWHKRMDSTGAPPNIKLMTERCRHLANTMRDWLLETTDLSAETAAVYENTVLYLVYNDHREALQSLIVATAEKRAARCHAPFYREFLRDLSHYLTIPGYQFHTMDQIPHLFACLFQVRRAFHFIFENIIGGSLSAARFRASVWESIFTHDVPRYRRSLYKRMDDITTLITGPSGTGKELVAQAIGRSRYIPFNEKTLKFNGDFSETLYPLNLSALSPTLIESELFGHLKGAFTGAIQDRRGWFDVCPVGGTIFLDEIGEVDQSTQVKLLRVLQTRSFQPIGGTDSRRFHGKVIAATNRDLAVEIEQGTFRADLYYRLCSDHIVTPALRDQIRESPDHLHNLLVFLCRNIAGEEEAESLAEESEAWIRKHLGMDYPWPGNIRELEQCVRNLVVRRNYSPHKAKSTDARDRLLEAVRNGNLTADELLEQYATLVYAQTRNYQETGRRLGLDGRTAKARVNRTLLEEFTR